ncbi:major facilitator superfamily domain-containing protein [Xylariaceae sp. FL1019]|nr:major facilitator superfamily domain-containing protein [Xylariaceae sp. FL1019]
MDSHHREAPLGDDMTSTTATEDTPLLSPRAESPALSGVSSEIYRDNPAGNQEHQEDLDTPNQKVSKRRGVAIILSVYVLIFLLAMNMSGITMAQSTIAEDLDAYEYAMWFTTSFLVAMSSMSPLVGKLATIFSPRIMLLASAAEFALGSVITSQARTFAVFILGRVVTGAGGGGIMVLSFVLVLELTTKRNRGLFVGLLNTGLTSGVSLGAVVFGALLARVGWRALFWIQAPVGLLSGCSIFFSIPRTMSSNLSRVGDNMSTGTKLKRIDYFGAIFLCTTVVLFLFGLSNNVEPIPMGLSLVSLAVFVCIEKFGAVDPIIPLTVLQSRGALLSCVSQLGFMAARWAVLFYTPITALAIFGFSPAASGSLLVPTNLGFALGGILVGAFHVRRPGSFWLPALLCYVLFALSLLALSLCATKTTPLSLFIAVVFINGLFTGGGLNYTLAHLLHLTLPETHYVATSLLGTFRGFAGSFGSAIGGGIFARTLRGTLEEGLKAIDGSEQLRKSRQELIRKLIGSPALVYSEGLTAEEHIVAVQGYTAAVKVLFQAGVVLTAIVLVLQAGTGWKGPADRVKEDPEAVADGIGIQSGRA